MLQTTSTQELSNRGAWVGELIELTHALAWAVHALLRRGMSVPSTSGKFLGDSFPQWEGLLVTLFKGQGQVQGRGHRAGGIG